MLGLLLALQVFVVAATARPEGHLASVRSGSLPVEESAPLWRDEEDDDDDEAMPADVEAARALKVAADASQRTGDFATAMEGYARALSVVIDDSTSPRADPEAAALVVASCHLNMARCCSKLGDDARAVACCDAALSAVEDCAVAAARPLRAGALYRRATARAALGDDDLALDDATRAVALGESRAGPLLRRLRPAGGLVHHDAPPVPAGVASGLSNLLAEPKRIAALVPFAKSLATPSALQDLGLEPGRARAISSFAQTLEPDVVEKWVKRAKTVLDVYRHVKRAVALLFLIGPYAFYAAIFLGMTRASWPLIVAPRQ